MERIAVVAVAAYMKSCDIHIEYSTIHHISSDVEHAAPDSRYIGVHAQKLYVALCSNMIYNISHVYVLDLIGIFRSPKKRRSSILLSDLGFRRAARQEGLRRLLRARLAVAAQGRDRSRSEADRRPRKSWLAVSVAGQLGLAAGQWFGIN